ncbi:MAG: glutamate 5-kinase [Saprospiraceae bacterium]
MKKRIVLKIGSSTLTQGSNRISRGKIEDIALQLQLLKEEYEIILVSSGAIAAAHQFVAHQVGAKIEVKQALAAIGQLHLMRIFQEVCSDHNMPIAQCLLTYHDFNNEHARINIRNTIDTLLNFGYTPIINENDTVATDEIKFGDNDKLAALTSILTGSSLLVLATDLDGLFDQDPKIHESAQLIENVTNLQPLIENIQPSKSSLGSGGMKSKLEAALLAQESGIPTWILNGGQNNFLINAINGQSKFTKIGI